MNLHIEIHQLSAQPVHKWFYEGMLAALFELSKSMYKQSDMFVNVVKTPYTVLHTKSVHT